MVSPALSKKYYFVVVVSRITEVADNKGHRDVFIISQE